MTGGAQLLPDVIEIQPCTEEGLVTLEAKLGGKDETEILDPVLLCRYVNATPAFDRPRCSPEMGYGMLEKDGRKIHAFKTGKVIVRRAQGREQALGYLHQVSRSIWPAMKVGGGEALVACLASKRGCEAFLAPPAEGGSLPLGPTLAVSLEAARRMPQWKRLEEALILLRELARSYPEKGFTKETEMAFRRAESPVLGFLCEVEKTTEASVGIAILSLSLQLERSAQAFNGLAPGDRLALWRLTLQAFDAVAEGETAPSGPLGEKLVAEGQKLNADVSAPLAIIALQGARLPG